MMRSTGILALFMLGVVPTLLGQRLDVRRYDATTYQDVSRSTFRNSAIHYGKWLTAAGTVAFTVFAANENRKSQREWNALLDICRSAQDACSVGTDGRYLRNDAELLYQKSRWYDKRANRRLLGAQASLLATAALFLLDLRPGSDGPDNIPFAGMRVSVEPTADGASLGLQVRF